MTNAPNRRYGGPVATLPKRLGVKFAIDGADMAEPAAVTDGLRPDRRYAELQWVVHPPDWVTNYNVTFWRYLQVLATDGSEHYGRWIKDETVSGLVSGSPEDMVYYQFACNQALAFQVTDVTGVPDTITGFEVLVTSVEKGA